MLGCLQSALVDLVVFTGSAITTIYICSRIPKESPFDHPRVRRFKGRRLLRSMGLQDERSVTIGLAVDVGSSSIRCSAYVLHRDGHVILIPGSMAQVKREVVGADGTGDARQILQDIDHVVNECIRFLREHALGHLVRAVGFAEFVMNMIGIGVGGGLVTPLLTYADHHAGTSEAALQLREALQRNGKLASMYEATGAPIHTGYAPPQLLRLAKEQPGCLREVWRWQTLAGLALRRWTGRRCTPMSYSEASWTGLLDFRRLEWCADLLSLLPCLTSDSGRTLPDLADYDDSAAAGRVVGRYARRWPELQNARLFLGLGDGACANVGSGCRDDSVLAATVGTSAAARVVVEAPGGPQAPASQIKVPYGLWCYRIDRRRVLIGGALTDGGSMLPFLDKTFGVQSGRGMEAAASALPADGHGLTLLPFPSGERAPGWNLDARAAIVGLTRATTQPQVYRATLEAVALRLGSIIRLLAGFLPPSLPISVSGTALQSSPLWRQILADVTNRQVLLGRATEATSAGVALLMAESLFQMRCPSTLDAECSHVPDPAAHDRYRSAMRRQQGLYDHLCNVKWEPQA